MIPVASTDLRGNEEAYVLDAIRDNWISSEGAYSARFEREFAHFVDSRCALAVSNGTVALHLALLALGAGPGDEVIVPSLTYVATANAVRYVGAEPVFVDVDPMTWCLDPVKAEEAITARTRGIIAVHLYGHPADMDAIMAVADPRGLWVIEDAAEAHGATYDGRTVGSLGTLATFSFYGNKIMTSGEGGAVTVDDPDLETTLRLIRGQGMDPDRRYWFPVVGHNFRLTNLACAILCAQLERLDSILARRREIFSLYRSQLEGIEQVGMQPISPWAGAAPWLFCITIEQSAPLDRDSVIAELASRGVETRPFFFPLHQLPPYVGGARARGIELPVTERLGATGMNLPTFNAMADEQVIEVCEAVRQAIGTSR